MLTIQERTRLEEFAAQIRMQVMIAIASFGKGHVGGSLSIADTLAVLYGKELNVDPQNPDWEDRDRVVLSKGHSGPALYAALALKGYFPLEMLKTLNQNGTNLPSHADRLKTPGVDVTTGSLGQGASTSIGLALADKNDGKTGVYTYLILGDGECQEGQVWESALFAVQRKLNNLITFVDANKKQLDGYVQDICDLKNLAEKFTAFGYNTIETKDGHDVGEIYNAIKNAKKCTDRPSVIILNTVKGKGVSRYETMFSNHSAAVTKENLEEALCELCFKGGECQGG
ncbi:MAG: transketolase [Dehalococcoidales bacterium]|nr:transketolase [Dehalococcoidales bacterium]